MMRWLAGPGSDPLSRGGGAAAAVGGPDPASAREVAKGSGAPIEQRERSRLHLRQDEALLLAACIGCSSLAFSQQWNVPPRCSDIPQPPARSNARHMAAPQFSRVVASSSSNVSGVLTIQLCDWAQALAGNGDGGATAEGSSRTMAPNWRGHESGRPSNQAFASPSTRSAPINLAPSPSPWTLSLSFQNRNARPTRVVMSNDEQGLDIVMFSNAGKARKH
jgi:hypothetical protein